MPCRYPITQYHAQSGSGWSFNPAKPHDDTRELPCGVCAECRVRKTRDWSIRCYHESQLHERSSWVTLTYARNPVSLVRRDVTLFFKSLRNAGKKFRYFGCGEYGSESLRPHYHICLFGLDFPDMYPWRRNKGNTLYRSAELEKHWPHGQAEIGHLTPETARYTAGYTFKKINGRAADEADPDTGLRPYDRITESGLIEVSQEQLYVSRMPGLGFGWFQKYWQDVYPRDRVVMNGREYLPPKYYDKLLEKFHPEVWETVKNARLEFVSENEITDERREAICEARENNRRRFNARNQI